MTNQIPNHDHEVVQVKMYIQRMETMEQLDREVVYVVMAIMYLL